MDPQDTTFPRPECSEPTGTRYNYFKSSKSPEPKYVFALDLHQNVPLLPRLLGSVVEATRFLGPSNCALSVIEGRSTDGTFEILDLLSREISELGALYYLNTSTLNPTVGARISILAELRNLALQPLTSYPEHYDKDTKVIFLNDVSICMEDILELVHQQSAQGADMVCAMDWTYAGEHPTFYDVWIARDMNGETFFNIPPDGNWDSAWNLFWANMETKARFEQHKPFQVFSCWNGATVFDAAAVLNQPVGDGIKFRASRDGECFRGEPELFAKDLWAAGRGKIAVVPAVNLEYSDSDAKRIKALRGYASSWVERDGKDEDEGRIEWRAEPPREVKCMRDYENQHFVPWDDGLGNGTGRG